MRTLSIIIPVYNEASYIKRCLENVIHIHMPGWQKEIIVVDDGSTDGTLALIHEFAHVHTIKILVSKRNCGKGSAIRKGVVAATGDILIIQDADLEYDPTDYQAILDIFEKAHAEVVYGSRNLGAKVYHNFSANSLFYLGGVLLTRLVNQAFRTNLTDQATCYKAWKHTLSPGLLTKCKRDGFEFEVEMTAYFSSQSSIVEVPIHYYPRSVNHGKKITIIDFIKSVVVLLRLRFSP